MLRRKLMLILGCVTGLIVTLAIVALWPLHNIFEDLDHISGEGAAALEQSHELTRHVGAVELELYRLQAGQTQRLDELIDHMRALHEAAKRIGEHYVIRDSPIAAVYRRMLSQLDVFERHVGALATTSDPYLAHRHNVEALTAATELRVDAERIGRFASQHVQAEQAALTGRFRWLVIGIALAFGLAINLSIMMMLRMAGLVLRPVDKLVRASRQLAAGNFDHRVEVGQADEFNELAVAYNQLAEQLQQTEQRRMEVIQQVALTLNHELNNAMAVIELQLQLMSRQSNGEMAAAPQFKQIQASLRRMSEVVESLKQIRRIVLADYTAGVKMLDLERSVAGEHDTE